MSDNIALQLQLMPSQLNYLELQHFTMLVTTLVRLVEDRIFQLLFLQFRVLTPDTTQVIYYLMQSSTTRPRPSD